MHGNACGAAGAGIGRDTETACPWPCTSDDDCSWHDLYCYAQGGNGLMPLAPFCLDDVCQCACGHRDDAGAFVPDACI
jgi:hypothetical protein